MVLRYRLYTASGQHIATVSKDALESAKRTYEDQYGKIRVEPVAIKDNRW